jgi:flagellar protein FlaG
MSTQINATQSSFANQATEFNATAQNKAQPVAEEALNKVTKEAEVAETKVNQFKDQQEITNKYFNSEDTLNEQNEQNEPLVIDEALELIADFMQLSSRNINFQQDDASDKTVIKFFDAESKELIKQFPSEEVLEIAQKIVALRQDVGEKTGIFLEEKV